MNKSLRLIAIADAGGAATVTVIVEAGWDCVGVAVDRA
jgi:hypothetical protein